MVALPVEALACVPVSKRGLAGGPSSVVEVGFPIAVAGALAPWVAPTGVTGAAELEGADRENEPLAPSDASSNDVGLGLDKLSAWSLEVPDP